MNEQLLRGNFKFLKDLNDELFNCEGTNFSINNGSKNKFIGIFEGKPLIEGLKDLIDRRVCLWK